MSVSADDGQTTEALTPISGDLLRRTMGRFATGVSIVTIPAGEEIRAVTVNSLTSVSLDPPLLLICIGHHARTLAMIQEAKRFCVNILAEDQQSLSDHFAGRRRGDTCEFDNYVFARTAHGAATISGALAYLDCRVVDTHEAGDHIIFIGLIVDAQFTEEGNPLLFFKGRYAKLPA